MNLTAFINPVVRINLLFPHQKVICPHSRLSEKYRIVTNDFTKDDLTDGNSPSYQRDAGLPENLARMVQTRIDLPKNLSEAGIHGPNHRD